MNFQDKKILFIGPIFHDYEKMIKSELESMGANVDFFAERSYSYDFNIVNNFFGNYMQRFQAKHYTKILNSIANKRYDYLFVIRGYMLPPSFLDAFKLNNLDCKTIMYQWDSERTNPFKHLINSFEVVKTFDFQDCEDFDIQYVPLFYTKDVEEHREKKKVYEYDFFFMGYFFEERYEAILKFKEYCSVKGYTLKPFLYMPFTTRVKYFLKRKALDRSVVSFKHMERIKYLDILSKSRIMVDVSNSRQTGLAMRVIESLACNTKVATNNTFFEKDEIVGKSGMVSLFDLDNINIEESFIGANIEQNKRIVLSLEEWLTQIFS
ncbi:hypothetical protein [Flavobacterium humidisoli]|uniref:Lipopolysaccharide biosynthesis protein n=1 Tax=Flavobacterium humidisoli TaxID=2937442 RepID=A0ABY4LV09_9FLAO|nr:hypothetical protein [Flavobacterium humidisoli]UPZ16064.1 hypothetical protein M0M44_01665 [Flavobacterium humidisoli]